MLEFLASYPGFESFESAEEKYTSAHKDALEMRALGLPYLRIAQERIQENPVEVLESVQAFCGVSTMLLSAELAKQEVNVSESMRGKTRQEREPVSWDMLSHETFEIARQIGYAPPANAVPRASLALAKSHSDSNAPVSGTSLVTTKVSPISKLRNAILRLVQ